MNITPLTGLCLAVRTDDDTGYLDAFLSHHLPMCERAVVLLSRRPCESPDDVSKLIADKFGDKVHLVDHVSEIFSDAETCRALSKAVQEDTRNKLILFLDKDEFIQKREMIPIVAHKIANHKARWARGWAVDRFGVGGKPVSRHLKTHAELDRAASVQAALTPKYMGSHSKCYMTRVGDGIRLHNGDNGWLSDDHNIRIEHYRWTEGFQERTEVKSAQNKERQGILEWKDRNVSRRTGDFKNKVLWNLRPKSDAAHGWFNYRDLYIRLAKEAPEGSTFVEVGVWCGRSLGFMASCVEFLDKKLKIYAYDSFDPLYALGPPKPNWYSGDWIDNVRGIVGETAPHADVTITQSDSVAAASLHEDGSVYTAFIDGDHTEAQVTKDLQAWLPKMAKGGTLSGHDINFGGVRKALNNLGLDWKPVSQTSWMVKIL